jgi:hypothetical protein
MPVRDKHSSLFRLYVSDGGKVFITIIPKVNVIKHLTFFATNEYAKKLECLSYILLYWCVGPGFFQVIDEGFLKH